MQTVFRHLIQQEEIPATPQSPALTSSSIKKVKESHNRPGVTHRVPGGLGSQIS